MPNSCRKWNRIFILLFTFTVHYIYGAYHSSTSCLKVSSSFPPIPRQVEIWAVSNLKFVLLSYTQLHSTTEVPFIVLAIYSLRSGTLKPRHEGCMQAAQICIWSIICYSKLFILLEIIVHNATQRNAVKQKLRECVRRVTHNTLIFFDDSVPACIRIRYRLISALLFRQHICWQMRLLHFLTRNKCFFPIVPTV